MPSSSPSTPTRSPVRRQAFRLARNARSRIRQAAIEKRAQRDLTDATVTRLQALGLLGAIDEPAARAELRELEGAIEALEELQSWVEAELAGLSAA